MIKKTNSKGFSLVELIIVVAIMAVLVGVMAPRFVKYLERTKYIKDCSAIGTVLDACETMGVDPDSTWVAGSAGEITITIGSTTTYSGGASSELDGYVPAANVKLDSTWGPFVITAQKDGSGAVSFDIANDSQISEIRKYSGAIADRLN